LIFGTKNPSSDLPVLLLKIQFVEIQFCFFPTLRGDFLKKNTTFSIILFVGYHTPDPAAWVVDISGGAGGDMDMAVHHALAGSAHRSPALKERGG